MALSASDLPTMYSLLVNSMSADASLRKPAEAALAQSENRPGFCSCLMEIVCSKELASQGPVRLAATLYFKNCISRYWRMRRDSGISSEEKTHLRQRLLLHLREENEQIASMLALVISKIARIDYPKEWPELFSVVARQLQQSDVLSSHRLFMILFQSLKELSTKRLPADQRNFAEITKQLFDYCWHLWQSDIETILHGFSIVAQNFCTSGAELHHDDLYLTCERWLLCSKVVRILVVSGYPRHIKEMEEVRQVLDVCPALLIAVQSFLRYYSSLQGQHSKFLVFLQRACVKLLKIIIAIQRAHPYSFGHKIVLQPVMDFCLNTIVDPGPDVLQFEEFLVQCMSTAKSVLECKEYKPSLTGRVVDEYVNTTEQRKKSVSSAVAAVLASLLPNDRVILLCNILIRRYFVLTASDLEEWDQNPESFYHQQDSLMWSEKLRPCAEALYIVLFENHSELLGPVVVSILQEAMSGCPFSVTEITPGLLLKDAAYGASAYVYYELSNHLSFKEWFNGALSLELSNDQPHMRIIHMKVALILGQWVSEIKDDTRGPVYCALIRLLQHRDLCVRLAASRSLYFHVEDANFSEHDFSSLTPICLDLCFKLIEEVEEFDSKVQALNTISALIAHVHDINPYADRLLQFFQKTWEGSAGQNLLQIQLLAALKNFVVALGYRSPTCYNVLLPILQSVMSVNSPDELLEDSMLLWEAVISNAPSMVPELLGCFPCLVDVFERSFEHLKVASGIIEGYIILGERSFLGMHAPVLAKLLDLAISNVSEKGLRSILPVIDILIQCFPVEAPPLINTSLQKLIMVCLTGSDDYDPSKTAVKAASAAILARTLVMNNNYMAQLTSEPSFLVQLQRANFPTEGNILLSLADVWLDKVDNVNATQRKAFGLALSVILTLRLPQVLDKLDQILSACTSVILGGREDLTEKEPSDCSTSGQPQVPSKEFRRRQIKLSDPINQVSLETSVKENLQTCADIHGESFNAAIGKMHPAAFAQLKQALKMP